jgi:dGTPase
LGGDGRFPLDARKEKESSPKWETEFQRDRDRILYSSALNRLAGITQVTASESGLGLHNRLTHSLKVAQLARRLAERLKSDRANPRYDQLEQVANLNTDSVEACALAHDLGHPPFGHIAEAKLNELSRTHGGFEGNAQTFRIVTRLAAGPQECGYEGLNLTRATLNGILKYPWLRGGEGYEQEKFGAYSVDEEWFDWARRGSPKGTRGETMGSRKQRCLEAELMDWADDVTYAVHDLEDFYRAGLIPFGALAGSGAERKRFEFSFGSDTPKGKKLREREGLTDDVLGQAVDELVKVIAVELREPFDGTLLANAKLADVAAKLIDRIMSSINPNHPPTDDDPRLVEIEISDRALVEVLKQLTWYYVIDRPALASIQTAQVRIIDTLFDHYWTAASGKKTQWRSFPVAQQDQLDYCNNDTQRVRVVTDFIAGMTEPKAYGLHGRLMGTVPGSILDALAG